MDVAMAPPLKRRKLLDFVWKDTSDQDEGVASSTESSAPFTHDIETLTYASSEHSEKTVPQRVEEVHLQIQQRAVVALEDARPLQPRQGTGGVSSTTSTTTSSTDSSTQTDSSLTSSTASAGATTATFSLSSTASAESTSSVATSSIGTGSTATTSLVSASGSSTPTSSIAGTNTSTFSSSGTAQSSAASSVQVAAATGLSSSSSNLTTFTYTSSEGSSTGLFPTTLTGNLSITSTTSHATSTTDLAAFLFLATLSDGSVTTLPRSSGAYTTTLDDGEVFTVPSISATTTSSRPTTTGTSDDDSASSGHAVTAVTYITTSIDEGGHAVQSTITSIATIEPQGAAGVASTTPPTTASTGLATSSNSSNDNTPPAGTIAGGVVGGAAGLAVVLLIAMLFVRWYRRRSQMGHQALAANPFMSPDPGTAASPSNQPGMAERAGLRPLAAVVPGFFRHSQQDRGLPESERGFMRVSGRKLPSQFSPGMQSNAMPPPQMPLTGERNMSTSSFYRDSEGFYGEGESPPHEYNNYRNPRRESGMMTVSQGPQRRPTIHHAGGPYAVSSPGTSEGHGNSSPPGTAATLADSSTASLTGEGMRGSRFNEEL